MRHQYQAFKCAGCSYLTTDKDELSYRAKVNRPGAGGETLLTHTPRCLALAVAEMMGVEVVAEPTVEERERFTKLPEEQVREQYETQGGGMIVAGRLPLEADE